MSDRQVIQSYRAGGFRVSDTVHDGPILVTAHATVTWPVTGLADADVASFQPLFGQSPAIEVLLIGCGERMQLVPKALKQALRDHGIVVDPMDTGAACRTYNVLMAEERSVAAALLPLAA